MKKTVLKKYAELIARMGVNVQKGQEVYIDAGLDQPEFVLMVAEACYALGASKVVIDWEYQPFTKLRYRHEHQKVLSEITKEEESRWQRYVEKIPCRIYLESDDPDGLKGIRSDKVAKAKQKRYPVYKSYRDQIENKYQWCIAAVPGEKWARKLFPHMTGKQAVEKLWEAILKTSRADAGDPCENWKKHNDELHRRCEYLNSLGIRSLHYRAGNGTDFTVGMIPEAEFKAASEMSLQNIEFNPNIPSEECFISPMKGKAEGIVYASLPLSYQGQLIEDFWIRFRDGKAVEWDAGKNAELLTEMITMDETSAYLGECALVPYTSPIRESGILFYNTLFDENAACHLALGAGFPDSLRDYEKYTLEEARKMGINDSMIHVDFMIGTSDLLITAETEDGTETEIFRNGVWAF